MSGENDLARTNDVLEETCWLRVMFRVRFLSGNKTSVVQPTRWLLEVEEVV